MSALLALASAATFGVADFLGGFATRNAHVLAVTLATNIAGGVLACVLVIVLGGEWSTTAMVWSAAAGLVGLGGLVLLYLGLAVGPNKLVSPVSAVVAAVVPVVAGLALGERPDTISLIGVAATPPAVWFLAGGELRIEHGANKAFSMALGGGFGFGLFFTLIAQVPEDSGAVPLLVARIATVTALLLAVGVKRPGRPDAKWAGVAIGAGTLDMSANGLFLWASRDGELAIVGALTSLFPATTVLLAVTVLGERLTRTQIGGLAMALAAAALLS